MSNDKVYALADGKKLGVSVFEILSLPEKCNGDFAGLLMELYNLCGSSATIEFFWISEKVDNQVFRSAIRIYGVIRIIEKDKVFIKRKVNVIKDSFVSVLQANGYEIKDVVPDDILWQDLLNGIDCEYAVALVKKEKCTANSQSMYPYYFCDVIPEGNNDNFNEIIETLCQTENTAISFQIFPTRFSDNESYVLNELSAELKSLASGTMVNHMMYQDHSAKEAYDILKYYYDQKNLPLFLYNILVFGKRSDCVKLASQISSFLQKGERRFITPVFSYIDISAERISLRDQFSYYTWNVNTRLMHYYRNQYLINNIPMAKLLHRLPYLMTYAEVTSFFRLPYYENGISGLKYNDHEYGKEYLSEKVVDEGNIPLGTLTTNNLSDVQIGCPLNLFTQHTLIVGVPGSGKTTFAIHLLLQFSKNKIPFLAIEPTKTEYRAMIDMIPELQIFTPGNNSVSPYIINPFTPPKGICVEQYIPGLVSAFEAAFSMPSPLNMIFLKAIRDCYNRYGWKDYSQAGDPDVTTFGLYEFILVFKELLSHTNYSREVKGNLESAGVLRLTNLIEQNSNIYDTIHTIPVDELLKEPTVLELNAIENVEQKALIIALLLIGVCIYTKHNFVGDGVLKNILLIDEAHVLLGNGGSDGNSEYPDSQGSTVRALQNMIAEIRSYGLGIIIADQSPSKVSREVIANTDIKVAFRLVQSAEKKLIADSMNMNESAIDRLSRLKSGEAYVFHRLLDEPQRVMTSDIRKEKGIRLSVQNEEVIERNKYWESHQALLCPYQECRYCNMQQEACDMIIRANAEYISSKAFYKFRTLIKDKETALKCIYQMPLLLKTEFETWTGEEKERLIICSRIKLMRKIMLEFPIKILEKEKEKIIPHLFDGTKI